MVTHTNSSLIKQKNKKEPEEVKSKDRVIRKNLDRIRVSAATAQPSNPSRRSQVSLTEKFLQEFTSTLSDRQRQKLRVKEMKENKKQELE